MKQIKHRVINGEHQFYVPAGEDDELILHMCITGEGVIIDVHDASGEIVKSAYQLWSDLEEMTH